MPSNTARTASRDDLETRRDEILTRVGLTMDELVRRRGLGMMTADEWAAWEELDGIDYLIS